MFASYPIKKLAITLTNAMVLIKLLAMVPFFKVIEDDPARE
ncbi:hypothetical protein [Armatimonas sp.]